MNIADLLIWEATNVLLLIPVMIALGDSDAVDTTPTPFHRPGIGFCPGESSLASPMAKIRGAMGRRSPDRFC